MGTDNIFHKKKQQKLDRKKETRDTKDKILIVCEGEKTEPNYFKALKQKFRTQAIDIEIDGNSDPAPINVVEHSIKKAKKEENGGDRYDIVYCVFDKDKHENFNRALDKIPKDKKHGAKFYAIISVPCFEFWLLLHFEKRGKNFYQNENTPCENLVNSELKSFIPDYIKGYKNFKDIITDENLEKAIKFAKEICKEHDIQEPEKIASLKKFTKDSNSFTNVFC